LSRGKCVFFFGIKLPYFQLRQYNGEKVMENHDSEKSAAGNKLDRVMAIPLLHELAAALEQISNEVLMAEYEKAVEILDSLLKRK